MATLNFTYWLLEGAGQQRFLNAHTTSNFAIKNAQPTALLNGAGRVLACAWIDVASDGLSSLWVLESSTVPIVQQHLSLSTRFARLCWKELEPTPIGLSVLVPWLQERNSGFFTAHDLSLDLLGFIDFQKGCYIGQEIVTRVHSRITEHKKRLFWITTDFFQDNNNFLYSVGGNILSVVDAMPAQTTQLSLENHSIRQAKSDDRGLCF